MKYTKMSKGISTDENRRAKMKLDVEGIFFLVFWLGGATLHTVYELKIKPVLEAHKDESSDYPGF